MKETTGNMPKVSVLIPAYDVESYIRECLDSVLQQTLQDFEIICVDDCSNDATLQVLREYEKKDSRIRICVHEKNQGQAAGRNHALDLASGEYVYMLDADDKIVPEALAELYASCVQDDLDVIGFETENFADSSEFDANARISTITYRDTDVMDGRQALTYCMETESFSLSTPTFMMRRAYLTDKKIRFVEGIFHEDVGYILSLLTQAERVRFVHKVYFLRRIRAASTMTRGFTDRNIEGYIKSFYKTFELEPVLQKYLETDPAFEKSFRKWQRDIFGRLNQLYADNMEKIAHLPGGTVDEETRRVFEMVKLTHPSVEKVDFPECYVCGTGQYAERAIRALGAQDVIVRGVIVLEKSSRNRASFCGFPLLTTTEACKDTPVVLSISHYTKENYRQELLNQGFQNLKELIL